MSKNHVKYFRDSRCSLTRTTMVGDDCDTNSTGSQRKMESYDFPNQKQRLSLVFNPMLNSDWAEYFIGSNFENHFE